MLELPECNANTFQIYLYELSKQKPSEYKIIVLDNGAFHKAKCLIIPENIKLVFLPPYSPELNPAEKIWAVMKRRFTNKTFKTIQELSDYIMEEVKMIRPEQVKKICSYDYIFSNLIWTI
jgi:transposase